MKIKFGKLAMLFAVALSVLTITPAFADDNDGGSQGPMPKERSGKMA